MNTVLSRNLCKMCSRLTGLLLIPLLKKFVQISQESSALRVVSADLTGKIKERQDVLELILKRLSWALRGLCVRLPTLILIDAAFMTQYEIV